MERWTSESRAISRCASAYPSEEVEATRWVRTMRGGTQAHLVQASNGASYVVKSPQNPQGRRVLVNEWITAGILEHLGLSGAPVCAIRITKSFLDASGASMAIRTGHHVAAWAPCLALGSRHISRDGTTAVYDYLPSSIIGTVANVAEFCGMLVVDKWLANQDFRQAVFCRDRVGRKHPSAPTHSQTKRLLAHFIDHGLALGGSRWEFLDAPLLAICRDSTVYRHVRGPADFEPYLDRVEGFPEDALAEIIKSVPGEWLESGEREHLNRIGDQLLARRQHVKMLLDETRFAAPAMFPSWS